MKQRTRPPFRKIISHYWSTIIILLYLHCGMMSVITELSLDWIAMKISFVFKIISPDRLRCIPIKGRSFWTGDNES